MTESFKLYFNIDGKCPWTREPTCLDNMDRLDLLQTLCCSGNFSKYFAGVDDLINCRLFVLGTQLPAGTTTEKQVELEGGGNPRLAFDNTFKLTRSSSTSATAGADEPVEGLYIFVDTRPGRTGKAIAAFARTRVGLAAVACAA